MSRLEKESEINTIINEDFIKLKNSLEEEKTHMQENQIRLNTVFDEEMKNQL